jgi:pilus assembly protein CpaE
MSEHHQNRGRDDGRESFTSNGYRVAVVEGHPRIQQKLMDLLGQVVQPRPFISVEMAIAKAGDTPLVIVLGPSAITPDTFGLLSQLKHERPSTAVVMAVRQYSEALGQRASSVGVADIVEMVSEAGRLGQAVLEVGDSLVTIDLRDVQPEAERTFIDFSDRNRERPQARPTRSRERNSGGQSSSRRSGKVVSVFSPKGGVGKSTVACNLAVSFAEKARGPVVLVDGDLQFGDLTVMMKVSPSHSIVDAAEAIDRLDVAMLEKIVITDQNTGVHLLASPFEPAMAERVQGEHFTRIIELLKSWAEVVVIDTSSHIDEVFLAAVENSDELVVVSNADIPSVKNVRSGLHLLEALNIDFDQMHLVVNRANDKGHVDVRELEKAFGMPANTLIDTDSSVTQALGRRTPLLVHAPKSSAARSIAQLADSIGLGASRSRRAKSAVSA